MAKPVVLASGTDGGAEISWTADMNYGRYINVYEITNGQKILRDRMCYQNDGANPQRYVRDTSVNIDGLTNGTTYTFAVTVMTFEGIESEATEVTVTPEKQEISKYEY